jgi:hypothetical protein
LDVSAIFNNFVHLYRDFSMPLVSREKKIHSSPTVSTIKSIAEETQKPIRKSRISRESTEIVNFISSRWTFWKRRKTSCTPAEDKLRQNGCWEGPILALHCLSYSSPRVSGELKIIAQVFGAIVDVVLGTATIAIISVVVIACMGCQGG